MAECDPERLQETGGSSERILRDSYFLLIVRDNKYDVVRK
jgi:hypothetical protein